MTEELDAVTIHKAARGDDRAFRELYDWYAPFLWKVIFRTVNGDGSAATEILQDTFIRIARSLKKYRFDSALSTWVYRIAYNCAMTYLSRRMVMAARQRPLSEATADGPCGVEERFDAREAVTRILAGLTPEERFLLLGREINGFSFDDLEAITGKTSGALRVRMSRLKETIRSTFADTEIPSLVSG